MRTGLDLEASIINSCINDLGTQRTQPLDEPGKLVIALMVARMRAERIEPYTARVDLMMQIDDMITGVEAMRG